MCPATGGHSEVVQELLGHSAAVDQQNIDASTALNMAAYKGYPRCVELLAGGRRRPLQAQPLWRRPLDTALTCKRLDCAMALLASRRADPNAVNGRGCHPLGLAGHCGVALQPEHLRALLDAGADMALACKPSMINSLGRAAAVLRRPSAHPAPTAGAHQVGTLGAERNL